MKHITLKPKGQLIACCFFMASDKIIYKNFEKYYRSSNCIASKYLSNVLVSNIIS